MRRYHLAAIMHFLAVLCLSIIAGSNVANAADNPDGLFLRKTVTTSPDADGDYWLDLEAYVTGSEKTICNLDPHFEYNVTETDWSWSYTPEGATSMTTTPTSTNPLTFTNIKNTNTVKNAEAMVENTFDSICTDASHSRLCNTTSDTAW